MADYDDYIGVFNSGDLRRSVIVGHERSTSSLRCTLWITENARTFSANEYFGKEI
jgi:hypothetical protein